MNMYRNKEGYRDPTAGEAIREADRLPKRVGEVIKTLKSIASLTGFRITKIEMRDRATGKEYKVNGNQDNKKDAG